MGPTTKEGMAGVGRVGPVQSLPERGVSRSTLHEKTPPFLVLRSFVVL